MGPRLVIRAGEVLHGRLTGFSTLFNEVLLNLVPSLLNLVPSLLNSVPVLLNMGPEKRVSGTSHMPHY